MRCCEVPSIVPFGKEGVFINAAPLCFPGRYLDGRCCKVPSLVPLSMEGTIINAATLCPMGVFSNSIIRLVLRINIEE